MGGELHGTACQRLRCGEPSQVAEHQGEVGEQRRIVRSQLERPSVSRFGGVVITELREDSAQERMEAGVVGKTGLSRFEQSSRFVEIRGAAREQLSPREQREKIIGALLTPEPQHFHRAFDVTQLDEHFGVVASRLP